MESYVVRFLESSCFFTWYNAPGIYGLFCFHSFCSFSLLVFRVWLFHSIECCGGVQECMSHCVGVQEYMPHVYVGYRGACHMYVGGAGVHVTFLWRAGVHATCVWGV